LDNLEKKVFETIQKYNLIQRGDRIVVAVSGGPDSICLLDILNKIKNKNCQLNPEPMAIFVAHVNHMIRKEACEDEAFVRDYCEKNGIEFFSKSIDVEKFANNNKMGTEEAGRFVRYEFFDEVAKKVGANKIAIAHNKNDSAETIIMNILRGTGVSGLKGIEPIKNNKYIRPLINCKREEIENYCEKNSLNPRIDKTNFENVYTRNKVRNIVIPYIKKEFNSNIVETITRLSELVKEDDDFIQNIVKEKYNDLCLGEEEKEIILNLKKFNLEEKVIKSKILLYTITRLMGNTQGVYKIHIEDIIKLCENNVGNKFLTPNKNIKILVKNHKIYFINQKNYNL
jgi:tRNA(ile)-lysidine synthetase